MDAQIMQDTINPMGQELKYATPGYNVAAPGAKRSLSEFFKPQQSGDEGSVGTATGGAKPVSINPSISSFFNQWRNLPGAAKFGTDVERSMMETGQFDPRQTLSTMVKGVSGPAPGRYADISNYSLTPEQQQYNRALLELMKGQPGGDIFGADWKGGEIGDPLVSGYLSAPEFSGLIGSSAGRGVADAFTSYLTNTLSIYPNTGGHWFNTQSRLANFLTTGSPSAAPSAPSGEVMPGAPPSGGAQLTLPGGQPVSTGDISPPSTPVVAPPSATPASPTQPTGVSPAQSEEELLAMIRAQYPTTTYWGGGYPGSAKL